MKKVHGAILICDVLFVTAAIFTSVIDVFLGIEMADAGTHRIKIANLCRFCGKTASSKKTFARPKEKLSLNSNDMVRQVTFAGCRLQVETTCLFELKSNKPQYKG